MKVEISNSEGNTLYWSALRLLASRDHFRTELRRKLLRRGDPDLVEQVLDNLEGQRLLNDEDLACRRARGHRQVQLWGNRRITGDLRRLGIDAKIIQQILEELEGETGQTEILQRVVQKWVGRHEVPTTKSGIKKLFEHCFRLGYEPELIRQKLEPYFGNATYD